MKRAIVTGGLGFVGSHLVEALESRGVEVLILDNMSRNGSHFFYESHKQQTRLITLGIDDPQLSTIFSEFLPDTIFHLAAQVAVTTSVEFPWKDFQTNCQGTVELLEASRSLNPMPRFLYASTNKVYGHIPECTLLLNTWNLPISFARGIPETFPLDFRSPYGCSKGVADQYVLDYGRTYGMSTGVLRKSCIYGSRQFGCEDQGWLAWFVIAAVVGRPITIYGDGFQVRDVLHVSDCVQAYLQLEEYLENNPPTSSIVLNIGGGPKNTLTLRKALDLISRELGSPIPWSYGALRPGDQEVYISDIRKARALLNWEPHISVTQGVKELLKWVIEHQADIRTVVS